MRAQATGEGDPDTCMRDAEGDGLESDRCPIDSDTDVRNPVHARKTAGSSRYDPKAGSDLRG